LKLKRTRDGERLGRPDDGGRGGDESGVVISSLAANAGDDEMPILDEELLGEMDVWRRSRVGFVRVALCFKR
jgi:hypothetical protein